MIVSDLNLLVYAYDAASPHHAKAAKWWEDCLSGSEPVGLPAVILLGFVRLCTNIRVFKNPMTPHEASEHVRAWLQSPVAQVLEARREHLEHVLKLLEAIGTGGNLVTDAQITALAVEHGAVVHTSDTDFGRFTGVRWFNPLTGAASSKRSKLSY